jgi:hypothetical protein
MTVRAARDMLIERIRTLEPRLGDVKAHYGRFNKEWLDELAARAPCAAVAVLGWPRNQPLKDGTLRAGVRMAIFIITRSTQMSDAEELLTDIAEELTRHLHDHRPGPDELLRVGRCQALSFENLTGAAEVADGLAMGSIALTLPVTIGDEPNYDGLFDDIDAVDSRMTELNSVETVVTPTSGGYDGWFGDNT